MAKDSIKKAITGISFLMMLTIILLFLYAQTLNESAIFPENILRWNQILTIYMITFAITMIIGFLFAKDVVMGMVRANYWKSFLIRFLPSAIITYIFLTIINMFITRTINPLESLRYMNPGILLFHLFVVSQIEEILFGGLIFRSIEKRTGEGSANVITIIVFMFWHFAKTGGNLIVMLIYAPLRYYWNHLSKNGTPILVKILPKYFGGTPKTQQANAGSHFAWNMFILGLNPGG